MKKFILFGWFATSLFFISCNNSKNESDTHTHEDGSVHSDHDTIKPEQQEFNVGDTTVIKDTGSHTHDDGRKHSH
jgi:hypothetical protein